MTNSIKAILIAGRGNTFKSTIAKKLIIDEVRNSHPIHSNDRSVTFVSTDIEGTHVQLEILRRLLALHTREAVSPWFKDHGFDLNFVNIGYNEVQDGLMEIRRISELEGLHYVCVDCINELNTHDAVSSLDVFEFFKSVKEKLNGRLYIVAHVGKEFSINPAVKREYKLRDHGISEICDRIFNAEVSKTPSAKAQGYPSEDISFEYDPEGL